MDSKYELNETFVENSKQKQNYRYNYDLNYDKLLQCAQKRNILQN